jgi:shikimate kinase
VVLIGPQQAGKHTAGKLVAQKLGWPVVDIHAVGPGYWAEIGYDEEAAGNAWRQGGFEGYYRHMLPFNVHAVERAVAEHPDSVLVLSPFHTVVEDATLFGRVKQALAPCEHVVLLLPDMDVDASLQVLLERSQILLPDGLEVNEHFVKHPSNGLLARHVVYTKDRTPEETRDEILARLDPSSPVVILIGPMGAGKSTQGQLLSEALGVPRTAMDEVRWDYYKEIGWSEAEQGEIREREGVVGMLDYWKRFEIHAVERLLAEHPADGPACVIDFGAGHSVYEDEALFERAQRVLSPYPNVVLLLPSPDAAESCRLLRERDTINGVPVARFFLTHPSFRELATHIVYNREQTPEETAEAILHCCAAGPMRP